VEALAGFVRSLKETLTNGKSNLAECFALSGMRGAGEGEPIATISMMNFRITHLSQSVPLNRAFFETATAPDEPEYWLGGFNLRRFLHEY